MDAGNYGKITRKSTQEPSDDSDESFDSTETQEQIEIIRVIINDLKNQRNNRSKMMDHLSNHFQTMNAKQKELQNRIDAVADEWRELNKIIAEDSVSIRSVLSSTAEYDEQDANHNDVSENSESFVDSSPERPPYDGSTFESYYQNRQTAQNNVNSRPNPSQ